MYASDKSNPDGITKVYGVSFPYIAQEHVEVYLGDTLLTEGVDYTWSNSQTISLTKAPSVGSGIIERRRNTPRGDLMVTFRDGSTLAADDLNISDTQELYVAQETSDMLANTIRVDGFLTWNGLGLRASNFANPQQPQDLTTQAWVSAQLASATVKGSGAPVLDSMATLRAIDHTKIDSVFVTSYYLGINTGGGPYHKVYDVAPSGWENGGTQITANDGAGWQMLAAVGALSPEQFGAIGDGTYHPISEQYASLAAAQAAHPGVASLTDSLDYVAIMAASKAALAFPSGSRRVEFPANRTWHFFQNMPDISTFTGVVWELNNGTLQFNRTGLSSNLIEGTAPDGFCIQNAKIVGGQLSGGATAGQGLSFSKPRNCRLTKVHFADTRGFAVLWFDQARDDASVAANTNNLVEGFTMDGGGIASCAVLFGNLSSSRAYGKAFNMASTVQAGSTGYVFDIKNNSQNCLMDVEVTGGYIAAACTDDGDSTLGIGAKNAVIRVVARNCKQALLANKVVDLKADVTSYGCGDLASSMAVVQAAGYNQQAEYNVSISSVNTGATVLSSRSDDQIFNVRYWDLTGGTFMDWSAAGTDRNMVYVQNTLRNTSRTTSIWSRVTVDPVASLNNQIRFAEDMQDLSYSTSYSVSWYPQMPGVARTACGLTFASNGTLYYVRMGSANVLQFNTAGGFFSPGADNTTTNGSASYRWSSIYAGTATINTSDEREKEDIRDISDAEKRVAVALKGSMKAFRFKDAVAAKGDKARIHFGTIAQKVKAAFEAEGLVAEDYGVLCYDEWEDQYEDVLDENGDPTGEQKLIIAAGNRYGVRYEELFALIISTI